MNTAIFKIGETQQLYTNRVKWTPNTGDTLKINGPKI